MPAGTRGITKDYVKQAYQRARRLIGGPVRGASGFENPALNQFVSAMRALNAKGNKMTKAERDITRTAIAKQFIESGYSTRTEIRSAYEKERKYMSEKAQQAIGGDLEKMAKWMESNKYQRFAMMAEYYLDSEQINFIVKERVQAENLTTKDFYTILRKATDAAYRNPKITAAELNDRILGYSV